MHQAQFGPRFMLVAAVAMAFLLTTLILKKADMHPIRAPASAFAKQSGDLTASHRSFASVSVVPTLPVAPDAATRVEPTSGATTPDTGLAQAEIAASTPPLADPSSFGSEAYEPIYSN
jgi:hypothetical protein